ncbi:MAG: DUF1574 family protein [Fimbriiglobus sp.]
MPTPSRSWSRRSRLAVIWGVALFGLTQLGLAIAAESSSRIRDPMYGDKLVKLRRLQASQPGPVVVMLGSSRTGLALNGRAAEDELKRPAVVFNFGVPSAGPITEHLYLQRLLADGITPDLLLIEILPSMLARRPQGPLEKELFFADRVKSHERRHLTDFGFDEAQVRDRYWRSALFPVSNLRFQLVSRLIPSWLPFQFRFDWSRGADDHGWGATPVQVVDPATREKSLARANAEYAPLLADYTPEGEACRALEAILDECQRRKIPVRLVLMPEGPTFRSWFPEVGYARLLAYLGKLARDKGVSLLVAREWLTEDAFYDSHHMFAAGAEDFSRRLAREVLAPALRAEAP